MNLTHIPMEDRAAAFDALMQKLNGTGRHVGNKLITKEVQTGPYEAIIATERCPIFEFTLRIDGHSDIVSATLALIKPSPEESGAFRKP